MKKKSSKSAPDAQRLVCSLMSFPCRWGGDLSKCFNLIWPHEQGGLEQQQRYLLGQSHFSCETCSPHHIPSSGTLFISRELIQNIACNLTKQKWGGIDACVTSILCKNKNSRPSNCDARRLARYYHTRGDPSHLSDALPVTTLDPCGYITSSTIFSLPCGAYEEPCHLRPSWHHPYQMS